MRQFYAILLLIVGMTTLSACHHHKPTPSKALEQTAIEIVKLIAQKGWQALATHVHPEKGLRFSPSAFIDVNNDIVFSQSQIAQLKNHANQIRTWGSYDGTGNPIKLSFNDYYQKFIYNKDYITINPSPANQTLAKGNTINNIAKVYQSYHYQFFDFYYSGSAEYSGMDWSSLRLIFLEIEDQWYLVNIVHDQWTI